MERKTDPVYVWFNRFSVVNLSYPVQHLTPMKTPYFEFGDGDETLLEVRAERRLYLGVFVNALVALESNNPTIRSRAIKWFEGCNALITFEEVKEMFNLTPKRLEKIQQFIKGEKVGEHKHNRVTS